MRPPVQGDDARIVDHLVENHHVFRSLEKLHVVVVGAWIHWRSGVEPDETTRAHAAVFRAVSGASPDFRHGIRSLPRLRCQGRNPPIRRIHNQRRAPIRYDLCAAVKPVLVIAANAIDEIRRARHSDPGIALESCSMRLCACFALPLQLLLFRSEPLSPPAYWGAPRG